MRTIVLALLALAAVGCGKKADNTAAAPAKEGDLPIQAAEGQAVRHLTLDEVLGTYTGRLLNKEAEENPVLPPSVSEVIGDSTLELRGDGRFTMTHKGVNFGGTFTYHEGSVTLLVDDVEGLDQEQIASADLAANQRAKKEPSTQEMLDLYRLIMHLTDWRFVTVKGGLKQVQAGAGQPQYEFTSKADS